MNYFMTALSDWFAKLLADWGNGLYSLLNSQIIVLGNTYTFLDVLAFRPVWDMIEALVDGWQ